MAAMSDYLEELVLRAVLLGEPLPVWSSVYLGLALSTPFTDAAYTSEVSGGGYARVEIAAGFTVADAGGGQWLGTLAAAHGFAAATGDWGSPPTDKIEGWAIFDAATAGHHLIHEVVTTPIPVYSGNVVYWDAGSLVIEAQ